MLYGHGHCIMFVYGSVCAHVDMFVAWISEWKCFVRDGKGLTQMVLQIETELSSA